jgi:AcrR family transcriptional regulator
MARKPAGKTSYHHGNLRAALLDAALAILERDGLAGLTLRKVAAKARVSHAAPAHHFPTLKALETALATIAFERFRDSMAAARAGVPATPAAQINAAGDGYLAFARENPALFRLMFVEGQLDWSDAALKDAATASFQQLVEISAPFADQLGLTSDADRAELQRLVWANAHIDGKMPEGTKAPDLARFLAPAKPRS